MESRLGLRQTTLLDEVRHERVVARDALELAIVQQVRARVAHLRDGCLVLEDEGGGECRAHARFTVPSWAPRKTASLALMTAAASASGLVLLGAWASMVVTAMLLATSPASWPPMPSATTKSGVLTR